MWTNSTPVTPEPMTVTLSGKTRAGSNRAWCQDAVAVGLTPVGDARSGSGGDEGGVELDGALSIGAGHSARVGRGETGGAVDDLDPLADEQLGRVVAHVILDARDPPVEGLDVDRRGGLGEPHSTDAMGEADRTAGGDHRLRRDAVPEVRRASNDVAFDHHDLGAEPRRVGGGLVAGGSAADDHKAMCHARRLPKGPDGRIGKVEHLEVRAVEEASDTSPPPSPPGSRSTASSVVSAGGGAVTMFGQ